MNFTTHHDNNRSDDHQRNDLQHQWVSLLDRYVWHHQAHLTFRSRRPLSMDATFFRFDGWANGLTRRTQGRVHWVAFPEQQKHSDRWHLHTLLQGTEPLPVQMMERRWRRCHGDQVRIEPFDPKSGILWYVTKMVDSEFSEARFSNGFLKAAKKVIEEI